MAGWHGMGRGALIALVLVAGVQSHAYGQDSLVKPRYSRLDSLLNQLASDAADIAGGPRVAAAARATPRQLGLVEFGMGRVGVTIRFTGTGDAIRRFVVSRGGHVAYTFAGAIEAYLEPAALPALNDLDGVTRVEAITRPVEQVTSQGVQVHNAAPWQAAGVGGQSVKVGIVDSGFLGALSLPVADTPSIAGVRCYIGGGLYTSDFSDCHAGTSHGTAVLEAVHDVAPGASFYLAKVETKGDFQAAVQWMTVEGVRVINASLSFPWDGPGDGTSPYADSPLRAIDAGVGGGALVTIAAGNYGESSWFGAWQDEDTDGRLEFAGSPERTCASLSAGQTISVQLRWQDVWGGATRDLDLELWHAPTDIMVARSNSVQAGGAADTPYEFLSYNVSVAGTYCLSVSSVAGTAPGWVQLQARQHAVKLDVRTWSGSLASPAETANPGALAVGAANWQTTSTLEPFSANGPAPDGRVKPDLVGVDGADSYTYGPNGFSGTSQATAHVAGLGALLAARYPGESPDRLAARLRRWALDRGEPLPDTSWGAGLAYLPSPRALTVVTSGRGSGRVSSTDSAIDCGAGCLASYPEEDVATLSASAAPGSTFAGWIGGGCFGTGACEVAMGGDTAVTAVFVAGALPPPFTDDPLVPGVTHVKAVHVTELRSRIDDLRVRHGLAPHPWTDAVIVPAATTIKAVHMTELRNAIGEVYVRAELPAPAFTADPIVAGTSVISAKHVVELRTAILAAW